MYNSLLGLSYSYDFFFFKQKTAYEITEGDWSSDVCSSDLLSCDSAKRYRDLVAKESRLIRAPFRNAAARSLIGKFAPAICPGGRRLQTCVHPDDQCDARILADISEQSELRKPHLQKRFLTRQRLALFVNPDCAKDVAAGLVVLPNDGFAKQGRQVHPLK